MKIADFLLKCCLPSSLRGALKSDFSKSHANFQTKIRVFYRVRRVKADLAI
jgi:hypothetical protein